VKEAKKSAMDRNITSLFFRFSNPRSNSPLRRITELPNRLKSPLMSAPSAIPVVTTMYKGDPTVGFKNKGKDEKSGCH
jgi:hypothetical protein